MIVLFIVLNIWDYLVQVAHDIPLLTLLLGGFFLIVFYVFGTRVRANLIAQNHRFREIGIVSLVFFCMHRYWTNKSNMDCILLYLPLIKTRRKLSQRLRNQQFNQILQNLSQDG